MQPSGLPARLIGSLRRLFRSLAPQTENPQNSEFLQALLVLGGVLFALTVLTYLCTTHSASGSR